jgi:hypothetical protein
LRRITNLEIFFVALLRIHSEAANLRISEELVVGRKEGRNIYWDWATPAKAACTLVSTFPQKTVRSSLCPINGAFATPQHIYKIYDIKRIYKVTKHEKDTLSTL